MKLLLLYLMFFDVNIACMDFAKEIHQKEYDLFQKELQNILTVSDVKDDSVKKVSLHLQLALSPAYSANILMKAHNSLEVTTLEELQTVYEQLLFKNVEEWTESHEEKTAFLFEQLLTIFETRNKFERARGEYSYGTMSAQACAFHICSEQHIQEFSSEQLQKEEQQIEEPQKSVSVWRSIFG